MIAAPRKKLPVATPSRGSYRSAVGSSSRTAMYTIMPATTP